MRPVITKYLKPTATKGARIKATDGTHVCILPFDYLMNEAENHAACARSLIIRMGWYKDSDSSVYSNYYSSCWHGAELPNGNKVFVMQTYPGETLDIDLRKVQR